MIKKLLTILLCIALGLGVLSGCRLFVLNEEKDLAESVAVIASRTLPIKIKKDNGGFEDSMFTSEERVVSKLELYNVFRQYGQDYQSQYGMSAQEAYDKLLDQLIERELLINEAQRLIAANLIKFRQSELNQIWKNVYDQIDDELYEFETEIAKEYDQEIYIRGQGEDLEPDWPVLEYAYAPDEDEDSDYEIKDNIIMDEEPWQPEGSRGPIFDYSIIEHGAEKAKQAYFKTDEYRLAALKTEDLRRFLQGIRERINPDILSPANAAKFEADLKKIDQYKNTPPHEFAKLYTQLQDFWFIRYLYYENAYNAMLFNKLQEYAEKDVAVTEEEVKAYYNKKLAEQKASFDADISNYISALKDGNDLILYHPQDVKWFYVKHILIPFSDEQKAKIDEYKKLGVSEEAVKAFRDKLAGQITSYAHEFGYNVGEPKHISVIENEIYGEMKHLEGKSSSAERKFEQLIFKYNTDPGIFNNVKGYGMQYATEKGESGYQLEFEEASFKLFEKGVLGAIEKAVTDYGVHYIMLSSIVKPETKQLGEYTSVFQDGLHDTTYQKALEKELLDKKKADAFTNYQNQILKQLNREWKPYITIYKDRYKRLVKLAKG